MSCWSVYFSLDSETSCVKFLISQSTLKTWNVIRDISHSHNPLRSSVMSFLPPGLQLTWDTDPTKVKTHFLLLRNLLNISTHDKCGEMGTRVKYQVFMKFVTGCFCDSFCGHITCRQHCEIFFLASVEVIHPDIMVISFDMWLMWAKDHAIKDLLMMRKYIINKHVITG